MTTSDLRALFQAKLKENPNNGFHTLDLDRLKDEKYLQRVMRHCDNDPKQGAEMLWDIFSWRKSVSANDINENNLRMDYVHEGGLFPHGRDVDGCLLLIVKSKKHVKGAKDFEELKKVIIYWFDRIEREENGDKITLFFDLDGCGLNNFDMELIKYVISLFKSYYPSFLNYIIIYQMPWVLSAAFKIVKGLLPARAIEKMKFVTKESLIDFVTPDQALTCWGGKDNYEFEFVSEGKGNTPKKVTFAEQGDHSPGEMLSLNPNNLIIFKNENEEVTGQFTITNMDDSVVSFKIRTTSPEKFRVRPSSGVLTKGANQTILIVVQPGFQLRNVMKDMFLVMSVQIPKTDLTQKELADIWANSSGSKVDEYRLKCQFPVKDLPKNGNLENNNQENTESITNALNDLQMNYEILNRRVKRLNIFQYITLLVTFIMVLLGFLLYQNTMENDEYCRRI
ncbi:motile sperm domain-containing protein 2-like [Pararge aegeria]|uniref:Jg9848 protein n=1 Tax=Pararge aegeria aegeria TaxID=348720 RepID=A0A8S4RMV1_9NEOP|nr:motile sperm domain-containing protein 2-like [Pararge aegeria]CAH2238560.1 jg9848 [Pararge aegeria aegeria]